MPTFQEFLNEKYPTKEDKEKVKEITTDLWKGLKIINQDETSHTLTRKEAEELDGKELNLSEYPNLEKVIIDGFYLKSELTSLDVSNCSELIELDCSENQITKLDLTNCTSLKEFDCGSNSLINLDCSHCPNLEKLNCSHNQITNLNIQGCSKLKELNYDKNPITDG